MSATTPKEQLLLRLAELMLEQQRTHLPLDALYEDAAVGPFIRNIQIDSPYQQLLFEGVLSQYLQDDHLVITFTVEAYCHLVLSLLLSGKERYDDPRALSDLLLNNGLKGLDEGVANVLTRDVRRKRYDRLTHFIDQGGRCLDASVPALTHSFLTQPVNEVIGELMKEPSVNDWLAVKRSYALLAENGRTEATGRLNDYLLNDQTLRDWILDRIDRDPVSYAQVLEVIGIYTGANALDPAKACFERLIGAIDAAHEGSGRDVLLCDALEGYGESEYARAGHDGYKRAMDALSRALALRLKREDTPPVVLAKTCRALGLAYLSLGYQFRESKKYLEMALEYYLRELPATDPACLDVEKILGIVTFWWGLRTIGRWGHAVPGLLENVQGDLFDTATAHFENVYGQFRSAYGKQHRRTTETCHYLQELHYTLGRYEQAIPWLKLIQNDNYYRYALIVSLEEAGLTAYRTGAAGRARSLLDEALGYARTYASDDSEITMRITAHVEAVLEGRPLQDPLIAPVGEPGELPENGRVRVRWKRYETAIPWNNWLSNPFLLDETAGLQFFYSLERKELRQYDLRSGAFELIPTTDWPDKATQLIYDARTGRFIGWPSIRDDVYSLPRSGGRWEVIGRGVHDVEACGAAFGWNTAAHRIFQFGGYGYFKCKNWWWEYNDREKRWEERLVNRPGISPFPRSFDAQIVPATKPGHLLLFSGIGSDTGLQREHKPRGGLGNSTDVGYFTWLRDLWDIDLRTMEWKNVLPANHSSIRHEGAFGVNRKHDLAFIWGGRIPAPIFGETEKVVEALSVLDLAQPEQGFLKCLYEGDLPPVQGGRLLDVPNAEKILLLHHDGLWEGHIVTRGADRAVAPGRTAVPSVEA